MLGCQGSFQVKCKLVLGLFMQSRQGDVLFLACLNFSWDVGNETGYVPYSTGAAWGQLGRVITYIIHSRMRYSKI